MKCVIHRLGPPFSIHSAKEDSGHFKTGDGKSMKMDICGLTQGRNGKIEDAGQAFL